MFREKMVSSGHSAHSAMNGALGKWYLFSLAIFISTNNIIQCQDCQCLLWSLNKYLPFCLVQIINIIE